MTKARPLPAQDLLRELLDYDPGTGVLTWKYRPEGAKQWNTRYAGTRAFTCIAKEGYPVGCLLGVRRLAHRVVFKMVYGTEPPQIDHANGIRSDNRLTNLRASNFEHNLRNQHKRVTNTSGFTGVSWHKGVGRWMASISIGKGKSRCIGYFDDINQANEAYLKTARELGYSRRHGQ